MDQREEDAVVEEPDDRSAEIVDRHGREAGWVFAALVAVAGPFYAIAGRGQWFFQDEWRFLSTRDGGSIDGLLDPHNEHWTTLPVVAYRLLWNLVGAHSYKPYQAMSISMHLVVVVLLRSVLRRIGVGPWIATASAAVLLFYGSGSTNIVWAFQITFTGAIAFGLAQLLVLDREDPGPARVVAGWALGLGALMCSGVGLIMVAAVGLALLLRRGWTAALRAMVPLGVVYLGWYLAFGRDTLPKPGVTTVLILRFVEVGLRRTAVTVGQHLLPTIAMGLLVVGGLALALWNNRRSFTDLRTRLGIPLAFVLGCIGFFVLTGISRAGAFGPDFADGSRYRYLALSMFLPVIAIASDGLVRRWRVALAPVLVVMIAGVPGNLRATTVKSNRQVTAGLVQALANSPALADAPGAETPFPDSGGARSITIDWLQRSAAEGRFPDESVSPDLQAEALARLALEVGPDQPLLDRCTPLTGEEKVPVTGDRAVVFRGAVTVQVAGPDGGRSQDQPVGSFERQSLTSTGVPLTLYIRPRPNAFPVLCR